MAIERYPAATCLVDASTGKGSSIEVLWSFDAMDALVCVLADADFHQGRTRPPVDLVIARQEGWNWTAERYEQA